MDPIRKLMDEHRVIETVLGAIPGYAAAVRRGEADAREDLGRFVASIRKNNNNLPRPWRCLEDLHRGFECLIHIGIPDHSEAVEGFGKQIFIPGWCRFEKNPRLVREGDG